MAVPSKSEVLDFSPINRGGREELPEFKRSAFPHIKKALKTGLIVGVTGLRRVGKSTLIKQALGGNSFYYSFDEKRYANPEALKRVIEVFLEEAEKPLIALDEVFRVEDWAGVIKHFHDQKRARFIVSGSSALLIKKGVESLSGRLDEHYLPPLSFNEYLQMHGKRSNPISPEDPFQSAGRKRFREEAGEFLWRGSFPELVNADSETARSYIKTSTVERIIFDDIPSTFRIEHVAKLYDLFALCATNSGQLFSEVGFAEALALSRHAVSDYLIYLNKAFLADIIYPEGSEQKALKKSKKIFAKTASMYNALADNPNAGQAAETAVYDAISLSRPSFYRDPQKREIDFVAGNKAIEVKYQNSITSDDTRTLLYFLRTRKQEGGIIVTKDTFDERTIEGKRIQFLPLDVFLRMQP